MSHSFKRLWISKNIPLTSRLGLNSKGANISCAIDRSWYSHEPDGLENLWVDAILMD